MHLFFVVRYNLPMTNAFYLTNVGMLLWKITQFLIQKCVFYALF